MKNLVKQIVIPLFLLLFSTISFSQESNKLFNFFDSLISGKNIPADWANQMNCNEPEPMLELSAGYLNHQQSTVRIFALQSGFFLYNKVSDPGSKNNFIKKVLAGFAERPEDDANALAFEFLKSLKKQEFSKEAQTILKNILTNSRHEYFGDLAMLASYLGMNGIKQLLIANNGQDEMTRQKIQTALARLGDKSALAGIFDQLSPGTSQTSTIVKWLPDVIFIKQDASADFAAGLILSGRFDCKSPDPANNFNIPCACLGAAILKEILIDFPVEYLPANLDVYSLSSSQLENIQNWVREKKGKYNINRDQY